MSSRFGLIALCVVLALTSPGAWSQDAEGWDRYLDRPRGPYRGQVVDAQTKAPLAGAVVVANWVRDRVYPVHMVVENYAVREAVTDTDGRFFMDVSDVEEGAPRRIRRPGFFIFLPGYGSYPMKHVSPTGFSGGIFEGAGAIVELPQLLDREERRKHLLLFGPSDFSDKPFKELPELIRRVNTERIAIGLEPHVSPE